MRSFEDIFAPVLNHFSTEFRIELGGGSETKKLHVLFAPSLAMLSTNFDDRVISATFSTARHSFLDFARSARDGID